MVNNNIDSKADKCGLSVMELIDNKTKLWKKNF